MDLNYVSNVEILCLQQSGTFGFHIYVDIGFLSFSCVGSKGHEDNLIRFNEALVGKMSRHSWGIKSKEECCLNCPDFFVGKKIKEKPPRFGDRKSPSFISQRCPWRRSFPSLSAEAPFSFGLLVDRHLEQWSLIGFHSLLISFWPWSAPFWMPLSNSMHLCFHCMYVRCLKFQEAPLQLGGEREKKQEGGGVLWGTAREYLRQGT